MKKTALALTLMLALLFSVVFGKWFVNMGGANPSRVETGSFDTLSINILSPKNQTYLTNPVNLTVRAGVHFSLYNIQYSVDGGPWMYLYSRLYGEAGPSGVITKSRPLSLFPGSHTITAKTVFFGHTACTNVTFAVDLVSPYLTLLLPESKNYNTAEIPLDFKTQGLLDIRYSLDGQEPVSVAGNIPLKGVPDGTHSLVFYGTSIFGTVYASDTVHFSVDTRPPAVSILSIENKTYDTPNIPLSFTVDESTSWVGYCLDGLSNVTMTENLTLTELSSGSHTLTIYANDTGGNMDASETISFNIAEKPFPTTLAIASVITVAVIGVGLLVYFKKRKRYAIFLCMRVF